MTGLVKMNILKLMEWFNKETSDYEELLEKRKEINELFRYIKNDWYLLYIILQIPVIICSSLLTFVCLKLFSRKKK